MPERPKRRKNNKNKRKNKSNRPDTNKNGSDINNVNLSNSETYDNETVKISSVAEATTAVITVLEEATNPSKGNQHIEITSSNTCLPVDNFNTNQTINAALTEPELQNTSAPHINHAAAYIVESPDQSLNKTKLKNLKSKSLDNDDTTNIVDVTENTSQLENDNTLTLIDSQNVIVSDVDTDTEWENADDLNIIYDPHELATGTSSVTTIPLTIAQCDQNKSLTPDEEKSLRSYLKTLNLTTQPVNLNSIEIKTEIEQIINQEIKQRLRKKGLADDFFLHRLGPPRILDVIDEEGSSESSITSRRQSYLSDKKSDVEDLEDDVFEDNKNKIIQRRELSTNTLFQKKKIGQLVPQECMLVGTKLKEPEFSEARGEWTMKTVEKLTGAEVVYLTDTSSSSSSLHEIGDDDGMDTDVSVRMMTPTIEVTDTENFLKKTFVSATQNDKDSEYNQNCKKNNVEHIIKIEHENDTKEEQKNKSVIKPESENSKQRICNSIHDNEPADVYDGATHANNMEIEKMTSKAKNCVESNYLDSLHEIVILSTDNIKTNLYVKDVDDNKECQQYSQPQKIDTPNLTNEEILRKQKEHDIESKIIKCEFNDAINNLIKEVTSDSELTEENTKEVLTRQDSSSSVDSSQCTAKYNPTHESLNDISNIVQDENSNKLNSVQISSSSSHVKDVFKYVPDTTMQNNCNIDLPLTLKDLCVRNIASLPYGDKILEELASVSKRLQNFTATEIKSEIAIKDQDQVNTIPHYQSPAISTIENISLPAKIKDPVPPPVQPRHSSLKKTHDDDNRTAIPTKSEPAYVCLSPSQKMLMDKTKTVVTKEYSNRLVDAKNKFSDRRGNNEYYKNVKQVGENEFNDPPIVPFKSQTGSRLLALIRDPTLTRNINSLNDRINNSIEEIQIKRSTLKSLTKNNEDSLSFSRNFSFKPIPPPRPKKYANAFYESDESSEFTDSSMRSMRSERKRFHYSTGNLNKEIEDDVSSIQNMHRNFLSAKNELQDNKYPRRPSLPKDLCEQQMEYIRRKEKEVEAEIQRLEALKSTVSSTQRKVPRAPIMSSKEITSENTTDYNTYYMSHKEDVSRSSESHGTKKGKMSSLFSSSQEELLREKMYSEYVTQMAEREERKQHKVIKITKSPSATYSSSIVSKSMSALDAFDSKVNNRIEEEFITKAKERWGKLGIKDPETDDEPESSQNIYKEPKVIEHKIKVIEGGKIKDVKKLPSHLQEFVGFTAKDKEHLGDSAGESKAGPATPHLVIMCAVIIIVIAVGKYFLRLLRYN